jgi:hypothetical protein
MSGLQRLTNRTCTAIAARGLVQLRQWPDLKPDVPFINLVVEATYWTTVFIEQVSKVRSLPSARGFWSSALRGKR